MKNEPKRQQHTDRQPSSKQLILIVVIAVVAVALIVAATVAALMYLSPGRDKTAPTLPEPTAATQSTSAPIPPTVVISTEDVPETQPLTEEPSGEIEMDEELRELLSYRGITEDTVLEQATSQIITVTSSGNTATVDFWEIDGSKWTKNDSLSVSGFVGETGATDEMSEYVRATPRGFFPVMDAFYINSEPDTGLDTFHITENTYWVDDPSSDFYNQRVEGTAYQDWSSAEHMIDYYSSYEYGFVIGYNLSCIKGAGSAIFFHVGSSPTAGCVAVSRDAVLSYLSALSKSANPYILIN